MLSQAFYMIGRFCASRRWEVIFISLAFLVWKISIVNTQVDNSRVCDYECSEENKGVEMVLLSIARCVAILYCIHQFLKLNKLGSTFLVTIGGVYTFLCLLQCIVFSINVADLSEGDFSELKRALPFYFLLMDITKAGLLAQFALSSSTQEEVRENIAQGMSILGPTITLDTIVETLVIGVGTLSGVRKLEELCSFACMSAVINYFIFMVLFPACLSLILELARDRDEGQPIWHLSTLTKILQQEEEQKPNPVLQRVKVIMSAGLVVVHARSRLPLLLGWKAFQHANKDTHSYSMNNSNWDIHVQRCFGNAAEMIMVAFFCTAALLYHYYIESRDDLSERLASAAISSPSRCPVAYQSSFSTQTAPSTVHESSSWHQETNMSSTSNSKPRTPVTYFKDAHSVSFSVGTNEKNKKPISTSEKSIQAEIMSINEEITDAYGYQKPRSLDDCKKILQSETGGSALTDEEVMILAEKKIISFHNLENVVKNPKRGVVIRRKLLANLAKRGQILESLPYYHYDYKLVMGSCCENVIGYVPIPVGVVGPLILDGEMLYVPMATTEGCLVASTNRGCRALSLSGGVRSSLLGDGMTRGPVVRLPSEIEAGEIKKWIEKRENFEILKVAFDSTSRFARLQSVEVQTAGPLAFLRFKAVTGDAMGMNMLSKGSDEALNKLREIFPSVEILSLSGNYCTDKKPAALNWIQGRGKEVVCGARIPAKVVKEVLKTDVTALVKLNIAKNYIGSAMAGSIGGFNAQAANIVTAIYLATGQDPAQNVTSSNCLTQIEVTGPDDKDLYISCTMPSIEVGTVGGGTFLPAQSSCLEMMGVKGPCDENPGNNASKLARIVCATVLAGELSLLSALAEGHLVRSHMTHNRSSVSVQSSLSSSSSSSPRPSLDNVLVNVNPST